jgi:hypothetical protein
MKKEIDLSFRFVVAINRSDDSYTLTNCNFTSYHYRYHLDDSIRHAELREIALISNIAYWLSRVEKFESIVLLQDSQTSKYRIEVV